ncbi:MAG TPA: hypothetical protein VGK52_12685 [Polyangia bacterium]|jgi:hypothetical protein
MATASSEQAAAPRDTGPTALNRYVELLRAQPPDRRLAQAVALTLAVRELAVAGIKQRHPRATRKEIRARLAVRLYGRTIAARLYGPIPEDAV